VSGALPVARKFIRKGATARFSSKTATCRPSSKSASSVRKTTARRPRSRRHSIRCSVRRVPPGRRCSGRKTPHPFESSTRLQRLRVVRAPSVTHAFRAHRSPPPSARSTSVRARIGGRSAARSAQGARGRTGGASLHVYPQGYRGFEPEWTQSSSLDGVHGGPRPARKRGGADRRSESRPLRQ
jgi:hypothetical protein